MRIDSGTMLGSTPIRPETAVISSVVIVPTILPGVPSLDERITLEITV
jgi:hypothetical protein